MPISRRYFFRSATLSLLGGVALPAVFAEAIAKVGGSLPHNPFPPENLIAFGGLTQQTFQRLVGEDFEVSSDGSSFGSISLISVDAVEPSKPVFQRVPLIGRVPLASTQKVTGFTARFQGTTPALLQGTYTLQNSSLGSIPLLLVPSQPGSSPQTYTAVFSFLVSAGR